MSTFINPPVQDAFNPIAAYKLLTTIRMETIDKKNTFVLEYLLQKDEQRYAHRAAAYSWLARHKLILWRGFHLSIHDSLLINLRLVP